MQVCDAVAMEPIRRHEFYMGRRVRRGLFRNTTGRLVNADINGALNIARLAVGDGPGGRGLPTQPGEVPGPVRPARHGEPSVREAMCVAKCSPRSRTGSG